VPADLAQDRRDGEPGEGTALGVEPVDGVEQPDRADLDEVVVRLPAAAEPLREVVDEGELRLDDPLAQGRPLGVVGG